MTNFTRPPLFDEDFALRTILEGTAGETGERFFEALVENLAKALNTYGAWVTEYNQETRRLRALAFLIGGEWLRNFDYDIAGTPCETVLEEKRLLHIEDNLLELYKGNPDVKGLSQTGAVSYMGVPLLDVDDNILGHMGVLHTRPMPENPQALAIFRIFAARATAELQRLRAEAETREREEKLSLLIGSAMDGIIELDRNCRVLIMNSAAEKVFGCTSDDAVGEDFTRFLADESREKFASLIKQLDNLPEDNQYLWIPGGLKAISTYGHEFPAEATLSRFEMHRETFFTLILRNVNDRLEAERRIRSLSAEAEYLREEVKELRNFDEIIGRSKPMLQVLNDISQVADTNATVLILGETGTGKELVARAIHAASRRREKPLIEVNCAAIPPALIESELFGHEQGAFTGATKRREGRFALADGGTIFLDEIGELPLDLQVKLLRVLQEGEFEPVGSSQTRKVNVRVVAATNRNLYQEVQNEKFREDLYYRLNVFPIMIPPLRERVDDIPPIALDFVKKFSQSMGRTIEPLSQQCIERLKAYSWPGNVRELQNVIERAVITSQNGKLNLDRALPETAKELPITADAEIEEKNIRVRTAKELQELEKQNIISALESVGWRITGENGAAQLMGIPPSTLRSRMKALGIKQPR